MFSLGILSYASGGTFKFQIVTTVVNQVFTLPISGGGSGRVQKFTAYWGDTTSSVISSYNDANRAHTYADIGTYEVELVGICQWLNFNSATVSTDKTCVRKLLEFTSNMGFTTLSFQNCTNLDTLCPLGPLVNLTSAQNMFNYTKITAIPAGLFDGCVNVTNMSNVFYNCFSLVTIPAELFRYNTKVTNFSTIFQNCTSLVTIPEDLFQYSPLGQLFSSCFNNCSSLTTIPNDLFKYNVAAQVFLLCFYRCSKITSIPTDLFRYTVIANNFGNIFSDCSLIASIPATLFSSCPLAWNFSGAFANTYSLLSIPTDLFRYNTAATDFSSCFSASNKITTIPASLFDYSISAITFYRTFYNCTSLTTAPADLFRLNTLCLNFSGTFQGCSKLQVNSDLFYQAGESATRFLNKSVSFSSCFYRTSFSGTIGTAPDLWNCDFGTGTPVTTLCYGGSGNSLSSLSNYASIPGAWRT